MPPANKIDKTKRTPPRKKASAKKHRRRKRPVLYRIAFLRWHDPDQVQGSGAGPSRLRRAPLEFYPYSVCFCRENDSTNPRGCQCGAKGGGRAHKKIPHGQAFVHGGLVSYRKEAGGLHGGAVISRSSPARPQCAPRARHRAGAAGAERRRCASAYPRPGRRRRRGRGTASPA